MTDASRRSRAPITLLAISALGLLLRLHRLDWQGLWFDEAWSAHLAAQPLAAIPFLLALTDTHPPLYTLLLAVWGRLAGESDFSLRAFSALAGTLAVPLGYRVGSRLASPRGAATGAMLIALSPFLVYYAQEVRAYGLLTSALLAQMVLIPIPGERLKATAGLRLGLLGSFFFLSFYTAALATAAVVAVIGWRQRRGWATLPGFLLGLAGGLAPAALWLPGLLAQRAAVGRVAVERLSGSALEDRLLWLGQYLRSGPPVEPFADPALGAALVGLGLILAVLGGRRAPLLSLAVGLPAAVLLILLLAMGAVGPHPRTYIWLLPPLLLLMGEGAAALPPLRGRSLLWAALAVYVVFAVPTLRRYYHDPGYARPDFRAAAAWLGEHLGPDDLAVFPYIDFAVQRYLQGGVPALYVGASQGLPAYREDLPDLWPAGTVPDRPEAVLDRLREELHPGRRVARVVWFGLERPDPLLDYALEAAGFRSASALAGAHGIEVYEVTGPLRLPADRALELAWGPARLQAAALPHTTRAGEAVPLALAWAPAERPLGVKLALLDGSGSSVSESDAPLRAGRSHHLLPLPPWLEPGEYTVAVRVYDPLSLEPLPLELGRVEAPLGRLRVDPPRPELALRELPTEVTRLGRPLPGLVVEGYTLTPPEPAWGQRVQLALWLRVTGPADGELVLRAGETGLAAPLRLRGWPPGGLMRLRRSLQLSRAGADSRVTLTAHWGGQEALLVTLEPRTPTAELPSPQHLLEAGFGSFARLIGFDLEGGPFSSQDTVPLTLYWEVIDTPPARELVVFTHLLDAGGELIGQHDGVPALGQEPVPGWIPGQVIVDPHPMTFSMGDYRGQALIEVGLYDPATGERVRLPDGRDHFILPLQLVIR